MDNTKQINSLQELAKYIKDSHVSSASGVQSLFNLIKYTFHDAYNNASEATPKNFTDPLDFGYGTGQQFMSHFGGVINSAKTDLDTKHRAARGVEGIDDLKALYIESGDKDSSSHSTVHVCQAKDLIDIIDQTIHTMKADDADKAHNTAHNYKDHTGNQKNGFHFKIH